MIRLQRGATTIERFGGATVVEWGGSVLLIDCPEGTAARLGSRVDYINAVVATSGSIDALGGLLALWCRVAENRGDAPLPLHVVLGDERGSALAETWLRDWGGALPVPVDAVRDGQEYDSGPFELVGYASRERSDGPAVALRITTPDVVLALIPRGALDAGRGCARGVDLALVELPRQTGRPGLAPSTTAERATNAAAGAREIVVVGPDGEAVDVALT